MEAPSPSSVVAGLATLGMIAQYLGVTLPTQNTSEANREANWYARDALNECREDRQHLRAELREAESRLFDLQNGDAP